MRNQQMLHKVFTNEAHDVNVVGQKVEKGVFRLQRFSKNVDYCDLESDAWIWSVGRNKSTGEILAATDARFYNNDEYECLFLR